MADVRDFAGYKKLDKIDRMLALSGVPFNLLSKKSNIDNVNFKDVTYRSKQAADNDPPIHVPKPQQTQYLDSLIAQSQHLGNALTLGIGGHPSDQPATDLAVMLCRLYYDSSQSETNMIPLVKWINLAYPDWNFLNHFETQTAMVVITGIGENSDNKRLERARDFIGKAEGCTCIYIVNTPNILEFSFEKLGITPESVFQIGRNVVKRSMR